MDNSRRGGLFGASQPNRTATTETWFPYSVAPEYAESNRRQIGRPPQGTKPKEKPRAIASEGLEIWPQLSCYFDAGLHRLASHSDTWSQYTFL